MCTACSGIPASRPSSAPNPKSLTRRRASRARTTRSSPKIRLSACRTRRCATASRALMPQRRPSITAGSRVSRRSWPVLESKPAACRKRLPKGAHSGIRSGAESCRRGPPRALVPQITANALSRRPAIRNARHVDVAHRLALCARREPAAERSSPGHNVGMRRWTYWHLRFGRVLTRAHPRAALRFGLSRADVRRPRHAGLCRSRRRPHGAEARG